MHPYLNLPSSSFWSRSIKLDPDPVGLVVASAPLISPDERVMSAGSCFAANLVPWLEEAGFNYIRTENNHPIQTLAPPENFSYGKFSASYGNVYTARQLLQLIQRCLGLFKPIDDRFYENDHVVDVFRPGLRYAAFSDAEFNRLKAKHMEATLAAFVHCDVFVFTLGLTEAWVSSRDGSVYPACPGIVSGKFDPDIHLFKNFSVVETTVDLCAFSELFFRINPSARIVLTVSPVPLAATATGEHVLSATTYSKSVLRVAAQDVSNQDARVRYFPAYEIITGPQAPENFFEADRRNPSSRGIEAVMRAFFHSCLIPQAEQPSVSVTKAPQGAPSAGAAVAQYAQPQSLEVGSQLSALITSAECEEVMTDWVARSAATS